MSVAETPLVRGAAGGLRPDGPGWFLVHADEVEHLGIPDHAFTALEGDHRWTQFGMGIDQLAPGFGNAMYHYEAFDDESFLVLDGTCDLVIAGELHHLDAGTFVHCPAGTAHAFVGTGDRPCRVFMFGARSKLPAGAEDDGAYVPDLRAAELGVSVVERTSDSDVAYAGRPDYAPASPLTPFAIDRSPRTITPTHGDGSNGSAKLEEGPFGGRMPTTAGWFILHLDDALWVDSGQVASAWIQGRTDDLFQQYGVNVRVARPGAPVCAYHREKHFDEAFLVLDGEGVLIVEGEERTVRAGDVFWCPAGTGHVFVAGGDSHLALLLVGTRDIELEQRDPECLEYPVEPVAAPYGASATTHTFVPDEVYADWPESEPTASPPWRWRAAR